MKTIQFAHEFQRKHFAWFSGMDLPYFSVTAEVEIGELLATARRRSLPFTSTVVYLVSRAANGVPQLRRRIRGEEVVEHDVVHPSFTVKSDIEDMFSFCEVEYRPDFPDFVRRAEERKEAMRRRPSLEDVPGRDDYLFLSALPWVSFTAVTHPVNLEEADSVPRIVWGKYRSVGPHDPPRIMMPVSIQVHHALVDGVHVGRFFEGLQELLDRSAELTG